MPLEKEVSDLALPAAKSGTSLVVRVWTTVFMKKSCVCAQFTKHFLAQ